jgi:hypothetical protein
MMGPMSTRTKRTYNLSTTAIERVRRLSEASATFRTQDAVVEAAIERLYDQVRSEEELELWTRAAADAEFRTEAATIAAVFDDPGRWPA